MPFTPKDWENFPSTTTPLNAEALEDLETRVTDYADDEIAPLTARSFVESSPQETVYLGNATESEYTGEPNIPIQVKTYHGNLGGYPVTGRPQGIQIISKYFASTTADTAQAGSSGAFLVEAGAQITQTLPLTGFEGTAVTQADNILDNKATGVVGSVDAQDTSHIDTAICLYAAAKSASDAGASIDFWAGLYVENPTVVGTVTDYAGVYARPRIQTETGAIIGTTQANTTAALKGTTLHVVGTNTSGNPAVKIVKKSGSTDNLFEIADSGAVPTIIVNQAGQFFIKTSGASHSGGSAVGAMLGIGNITTPPSANFTGGSGYFQYSVGGAAKFRMGGGNIVTLPNSPTTITGSRAGNVALAGLLTDLAALGLIVDGTTA